MEIIEYMLIGFLIVCAVAAICAKKMLTTVLIFLSYSVSMCIVWILLESPDLAITEAAVGAGINGVLLFITLKKVHDLGGTRDE